MSLFVRDTDKATLNEALTEFFSLYGNSKRISENKVNFHKTEFWRSRDISDRGFLIIAMDLIERKDIGKLFDCWREGKNVILLYESLYIIE